MIYKYIILYLLLLPFIYTKLIDKSTSASSSTTTSSIPTSSTTSSSTPTSSKSDIYLISTLDGSIHIIDKYTGKLMYIFITNSTLIESDKLVADEEIESESKDILTYNNKNNIIVIPSLDGTLYYSEVDSNNNIVSLDLLPISIIDIVSASPFDASDGIRYLSSKSTTSYLFDLKNGNIDQIITSSSTDNMEEDNNNKRHSWLNRIDWKIQAYDINNKKSKWTISLSEYLSSSKLEETYSLYSSTSGILESIKDSWTIDLKSPVAKVFYSHSGSLTNDLIPVNVIYNDIENGVYVGENNDKSMYIINNKKKIELGTDADVKDISIILNKLTTPSDIETDDNEFGSSLAIINTASSIVPYVKPGNNGRFVTIGKSGFASKSYYEMVKSMAEGMKLNNKFRQSYYNLPAEILALTWHPSKNQIYDDEHPSNSSSVEEELENLQLQLYYYYYSMGFIILALLYVAIYFFLDNFWYKKTPIEVMSENVSESIENVKDGRSIKSVKSGIDAEGRSYQEIGHIRIFPKQFLGMGSHGTIVYCGEMHGRPVAVKRFLSEFYDAANKEIKLLIDSDGHPNVLRYFAMESDMDFVYIALELCRTSLATLIESVDKSSPDGDLQALTNQLYYGHQFFECKIFEPKQKIDNLEFNAFVYCKNPNIIDTKPLVCPRLVSCSAQLINFLKESLSGLAYIHSLNIVHRDIKPHNILINMNNVAKICDMGLGKKLEYNTSYGGTSSYGMKCPSGNDNATGAVGSIGWQAVEVLQGGRLTKAVDVFSMGCVMYFMLSGGKHPFGNRLVRDANILSGNVDLSALQIMSEALHCVSNMLLADPSERFTANEALTHPFFWSDADKLQFLVDASDRLESEPEDSELRIALEGRSREIIGVSWELSLHPGLTENTGKVYRRYDFSSLVSCLRVIRNKRNHYREMPEAVQAEVGPIPSAFLNYFLHVNRFPKLLLYVWMCFGIFCAHEVNFQKHYPFITDSVRKRFKDAICYEYRGWYPNFNQ